MHVTGKFPFPNDTFHSEIRWFQRFRYSADATGPSDFYIPSRACEFRNTQHELLSIGSCPAWVNNETDNGTLSYPRLQGLYTLSTWAYVTAEVYIYSDNEIVMDDDVKTMGSQFFVSYMDNVLKDANWRRPLNQRFISISSAFDARSATRDKVRPKFWIGERCGTWQPTIFPSLQAPLIIGVLLCFLWCCSSV